MVARLQPSANRRSSDARIYADNNPQHYEGDRWEWQPCQGAPAGSEPADCLFDRVDRIFMEPENEGCLDPSAPQGHMEDDFQRDNGQNPNRFLITVSDLEHCLRVLMILSISCAIGYSNWRIIILWLLSTRTTILEIGRLRRSVVLAAVSCYMRLQISISDRFKFLLRVNLVLPHLVPYTG